jgi:hypothetical protein
MPQILIPLYGPLLRTAALLSRFRYVIESAQVVPPTPVTSPHYGGGECVNGTMEYSVLM